MSGPPPVSQGKCAPSFQSSFPSRLPSPPTYRGRSRLSLGRRCTSDEIWAVTRAVEPINCEHSPLLAAQATPSSRLGASSLQQSRDRLNAITELTTTTADAAAAELLKQEARMARLQRYATHRVSLPSTTAAMVSSPRTAGASTTLVRASTSSSSGGTRGVRRCRLHRSAAQARAILLMPPRARCADEGR